MNLRLALPPSLKRCRCDTGNGYDECCGPIISGRRQAMTALELMRSRFTAYATNDVDYLLYSWASTTQPASLEVSPHTRWESLEILATDRGGPTDSTGQVRFLARYRERGLEQTIAELSEFERSKGRWVYVGGTHYTNPRNQPST